MTDQNTTLSEREAAVLAFVQSYCQRERIPPTLREIAAGCHVAHSMVGGYLDSLHIKGYIVRKRGVSRGIRLLTGEGRKL